jgi:hypothetical protein
MFSLEHRKKIVALGIGSLEDLPHLLFNWIRELN